ncbi:MAG: sulfite oxidase heme-binding subunit YedZ [Marinicella sp.]
MIKHIKLLKSLLFLLCLVPLGMLIYAGFQNNLTANPIEYITHQTGIWTLRFLLLTLAMTPLKIMTGAAVFIRIRRMLGLFTFFYCTLHLVIYFWLDLGLDWQLIIEDITEHLYVTVGMLAWLLMLPMAITSNKKMIRKMGKHWKKLHQSIYLVIALGCLHFIWLVKSDITEPLIYTGIGLSLLLFRVIHYLNGKRTQK